MKAMSKKKKFESEWIELPLMAPPFRLDFKPAKVADVRMKSLRDRVFIDRVGPANSVLTDVLTLEQVDLGEGEWCVDISEDGMDAVVSREGRDEDSEGEVQDLDAVLKRSCVRVSNEEEHWVVNATADGDVTQEWSIEHEDTKHLMATLKFNRKGCHAHGDIDAAFMLRSRSGGVRVYWSIVDMYDVLSVQAYTSSGRWCWDKAHNVMMPMFKKHLGEGHLIFSKHGNGTKRRKEMSWRDRCLTFTAASTAGMLMFLAKWAYSTDNSKVCLKLHDDKMSAESCVSSCIQTAAQQFGASMTIVLDEDFQHPWPRPLESPCTLCLYVMFLVLSSGCVRAGVPL